jgi:hypothetical protein
MYTKWTEHLKDDPNAKLRFEAAVQGSKQVLDRLMVLIDEEIKALDQSEMDAKAYDNPSWAYKQAYKNGCRKAFTVLKTYVDLDKQVIRNDTAR